MTDRNKPRRPRKKLGTNDPSYEVGYGKPPKDHQFRKGQSGNPMGRPKGANKQTGEKLFIEALQEQLDRKVEVREAGGVSNISTKEVIIRRVVTSAAQGQTASLKILLKLLQENDEDIIERRKELIDSAREIEVKIRQFLEMRPPVLDLYDAKRNPKIVVDAERAQAYYYFRLDNDEIVNYIQTSFFMEEVERERDEVMHALRDIPPSERKALANLLTFVPVGEKAGVVLLLLKAPPHDRKCLFERLRTENNWPTTPAEAYERRFQE